MLEAIYLYVILHDDNSNGERFRTRMPDMVTCERVLEKAKMPMPTSPNGDYEVMGVMFCGTGDFDRQYGGVWWKDPVKKHDGR